MRERSDSTTFGTDTANGYGTSNGNANGSSNDADPAPPPSGSGLIGACDLVGDILDQVALRDCPPDNEADLHGHGLGVGGNGLVGFDGKTAALGSPQRQGKHGRKSAKATRSGWGQEGRGFSRQRHVHAGPTSLKSLTSGLARSGGGKAAAAAAAAKTPPRTSAGPAGLRPVSYTHLTPPTKA